MSRSITVLRGSVLDRDRDRRAVSRENADVKARRYLGEGRVIAREIDEYAGTAMADVRGDGAIWIVGRDEGGWFCDCPARGRCAHQLALDLIVAVEGHDQSRGL